MKQEEPILVAIRCTVYNHEPYLRDCLEGFVMQKTNFRFVAVVHDDCSTDNSVAIIREYAEKYPDIIKPIYETENQYSKHDGSLGRIMNTAIDATGAKYIAMCEGDDYWTDPYKLQKQVDYMEAHPECGLCYCDCDIFYEKSDTFLKCINASENSKIDIVHPMFSYGYLSNMTWLWRNEIPLVRTPGVIDGAIEMLLNIALNSKIGFCEGPSVGVYRRHEGSASCFTAEDVEREYNYHVNSFKLMLSYIDKFPDVGELKKHIIGGSIFDLYEKALQRGDNETISVFERYFSDFIDIKIINDEIKLKYKFLEECQKIRSSKAYRLGKLLLKPFRWMKRK